MIIDIPTAEDFQNHGLRFLNLSWDAIFDLLVTLSESQEMNWTLDDEMVESFWTAAEKPVSLANALAQQGAELILKSIIASHSPFLLISSPPSEWTKEIANGEVSFADFRTIDAQDLIKACNMVGKSPLPEKFITTFNKFRKMRNALFHTVDHRLVFSVKEIVLYILTSSHLVKPGKWPQIRMEYLDDTPIAQAFSTDDNMNRLSREMDNMISIIGRADLLELFSFDKKSRRYICPICYSNCNHDDEITPLTAQLKPNSPDSKIVHCFVCGEDTVVERKKCTHPGCRSNVIHASESGYHECLICLDSPEDED